MTIGLSLPVKYLAGKTVDVPHFSNEWKNPEDCLAELRNNGVGSIEIQGIGPGSFAGDLSTAAHRVIGSGMRVSVHGHLSGNAHRATSGNAECLLLPDGDILEEQLGDTIVVVHALAGGGKSHIEIAESTAQTLDRVVDHIRGHDLPIRVALEIERHHGVDSPGVTYDGLLSIAGRLAEAEIGFCWDMGHTRSSILQNRLPPEPPPEFVTKVIHVHVHGLSPDGDTHWPLTASSSHIAPCVLQLERCGYRGVYNLELYPTRWPKSRSVREEILGSIMHLREILRQ